MGRGFLRQHAADIDLVGGLSLSKEPLGSPEGMRACRLGTPGARRSFAGTPSHLRGHAAELLEMI